MIGDEATVLMMTMPGMLEEFLGEFHVVEDDARNQVAAKYGITFLPE